MGRVRFLEVAVILLGTDALLLDVPLPRLVVMAFIGRHAASLRSGVQLRMQLYVTGWARGVQIPAS